MSAIDVFDVDVKDADSVYAFLDEGGYSCELLLFPRSAYIWDADSDDGQWRIPVAVARSLIASGKIAVWHDQTYRPSRWVEQWNQQYPGDRQQTSVAD
ncbi:MAG TPA: hypothetical protein VMV29_09835 [Ktedonobacterales bacterium]|nr:hypothetical protein [Ktedonobacterales bacterium]